MFNVEPKGVLEVTRNYIDAVLGNDTLNRGLDHHRVFEGELKVLAGFIGKMIPGLHAPHHVMAAHLLIADIIDVDDLLENKGVTDSFLQHLLRSLNDGVGLSDSTQQDIVRIAYLQGHITGRTTLSHVPAEPPLEGDHKWLPYVTVQLQRIRETCGMQPIYREGV